MYKNKIKQCKGKNDKAPVAQYRPYVQQFVRTKKLDIDGDFKSICLIKCGGKYYDLFNLPKDKKLVLHGNLNLEDMGLTELPDLSNLVVEGYFNCRKNKLANLLGAPAMVLGDFYADNNELVTLQGLSKGISSLYCKNNRLTSLRYVPEVIRDLYCENNYLRNFNGAPKRVKGILNANLNPLVSFDGFPDKVEGMFHAINTDLEAFENIAGRMKSSVFIYNPKKGFFIVKQKGKLLDLTKQPEGFVYNGFIDVSDCKLQKLPDLSHIIVKEDFYCENNLLTSFVGSPKEVEGIYIGNDNPVTSLEGLPGKIGCQLDLMGCPELVTLKGMSKEIGECLNLYECPKLDNLDYLPQKGCAVMRIDRRLIDKYHIESGATLNDVKKAVAEYNAGLRAGANTRD